MNEIIHPRFRSIIEFYPSGTDDAPRLLQILTGAAYNSIVYFRPGTYHFDTVIQMPSGTHIVANKNVQIIASYVPTGTGDPNRSVFYAIPPNSTKTTTLSSDTIIGSNTISVASASSFTIGDEIAIFETNLLASYFITNIVSNTITLDRKIVQLFSSGSTVIDRISPKDIFIEGNGMRVSGTFDAIVEFSTAFNCHISGISGVATSGSSGDVGYNLDVGSRFCSIIDCSFDGKGVFSQCLHFESTENCYGRQLELKGGLNSGILITAGFGNTLINTICRENVVGFNLSTAKSNYGARSLTLLNCQAFGNSGIGFDINYGQKIFFIGCESRYNSGSGIAVNTGSSDIVIDSCNTSNNQNGIITVSGTTNTLISNTISNNNSSYGFDLEGSALLNNVTSSECSSGGIACINVKSQIQNAKLSSTSGSLWFGLRTESGGSFSGNNIQIDMSNGTKIAVSYTSTAYSYLSNVKSSGGTYGWLSTAGGLRRGPNVDFSSASTPFDISLGGTLSFGTLTLNGASNVDLSFPDTKSTDRPRARRTSLSGTPGHFICTPVAGVGIRISGVALDTSTVEVDLI